jgi:hypothetical protein
MQVRSRRFQKTALLPTREFAEKEVAPLQTLIANRLRWPACLEIELRTHYGEVITTERTASITHGPEVAK